jgi:hypothetical protein
MTEDVLESALLRNVIMSRAELLTDLFSTHKDIDKECDYPRGNPTIFDYEKLYGRLGPANRVVRVFCKESWQVQPEVYEVEDSNRQTPFEKAVDGLSKGLRGENSWYQDSTSSPVWEYARRLDEMSGLGHYGLLLLGLDDDKDLSLPATPREGQKLLFLRVFPETLAPVATYETSLNSPRFGLPLTYNLRFTDPSTGQPMLDLTEVHWTRVLHAADNLESSEVFGVPRMKPVYNHLLDLKKLYGGSAEMYWRGAFPGISFESNPQLDPSTVRLNKEELQEEIGKYMMGLQRFLRLVGMQARSLAPQVVDPTHQIRVHIEAVCIQLGIPIRVFMGSERGELASTQDDEAWNDRVRDRENNYLTPRVIIPLFDRLIWLKVLPEPAGYSVFWPDITSQSNQQKADVAMKLTSALQQYATGNIEPVFPLLDFLTRILRFTDKEAASIIKRVTAAARDQKYFTVRQPSQAQSDQAAQDKAAQDQAAQGGGGAGGAGSNGKAKDGAGTGPNGQTADGNKPPAAGNFPPRIGR